MFVHYYTIIVVALNHTLYSYNCDVSLSHICLVLACNSKIKRQEEERQEGKHRILSHSISFTWEHKETT